MTLPSSSFDARRWLVACGLAVTLVMLQIGHATRVSGTEDSAPVSAPVSNAAPVTASMVEISGTVVASTDDLLAIRESSGTSPVAFVVGDNAGIARAGRAVDLAALRASDAVRLTVDPRSGRAFRVLAEPAPRGFVARVASFGPLAALALALSTLSLVLRGRHGAWLRTLFARRLGRIGRQLGGSSAVAGTNRPCGA